MCSIATGDDDVLTGANMPGKMLLVLVATCRFHRACLTQQSGNILGCLAVKMTSL